MQVSAKQRITLEEKAFFSIVNLGNIPIMTITGSFLMIFYTNVVGLDPAACATLFLVARVFDAVNDPFIGYIIDHLPNTKMGRFRPVLIVGSIACSINFLLTFLGPFFSTGSKLIVAYITYCMLGVTFPVMDISLNSMLPVMTTNSKERGALSSIKGISYAAGGFVLNISAPLIISDTTRPKGYFILIIICTLVVAIFSIVGTLGIKERVKPNHSTKYNFRDLLPIFRQRPVLSYFSANFFVGIGSSVAGTIGVYYYAHVLGNLSLLSIVTAIRVFSTLIGIGLTTVFVEKYGKKTLYLIGMIVAGLPITLLLIKPTSIPLLITLTAVSALGMGAISPLNYGMQADTTDYVEIALGKRAEAAIASLSSFVVKFSMGIGGALPGYLLAWGGFSASADTQPSTVNTVILVCFCIIPPILSLIGATVIGLFYPLTKEKLTTQEEEMNSLQIKSQ